MKLITRDTDYAVRALCFIARNKDRVVCASELVKELKVPRPFLRKILQSLNRGSVLKSYKGKGGGFLLNRPAEKIFLIDLMRIFQGGIELNECLFKKKLCPNREICLLRNKLVKVEKEVISHLESVSIASLQKDRK